MIYIYKNVKMFYILSKYINVPLYERIEKMFNSIIPFKISYVSKNVFIIIFYYYYFILLLFFMFSILSLKKICLNIYIILYFKSTY